MCKTTKSSNVNDYLHNLLLPSQTSIEAFVESAPPQQQASARIAPLLLQATKMAVISYGGVEIALGLFSSFIHLEMQDYNCANTVVYFGL